MIDGVVFAAGYVRVPDEFTVADDVVVEARNGEMEIELTRAEIEAGVGPARQDGEGHRSPGRLAQHYAPDAPVRIEAACERERSADSTWIARNCCQTMPEVSVATSATIIIASNSAAPR